MLLSAMSSPGMFPASGQSQCATSLLDRNCLFPQGSDPLASEFQCFVQMAGRGKQDDDLVDLVELLEQVEVEEPVGDSDAKPLHIDPAVLKIDLSGFSNHDRTLGCSVAGVTLRPNREVLAQRNRSSRHLSGGGILTDCPCHAAPEPPSPSSPLAFDLSSRISDAPTNPFKTFMNPFAAGVERVASINCRPAYENVTPPRRRTASQCSTRPVSPELTVAIPGESSGSTPSQGSPSTNPFLDTSPPPDTNPFKFLVSDVPSQLPPSSFIFALPVFPIFHNVAQSSCSTQTSEPEPPTTKLPDPVYQNNPSPHLRKFMHHHDHSDYDLQCLKGTLRELRTSGWYYENVSWQDSVVLLKNTEPGTFLVRDSSDANFLFSLSVQTSRGPTSVRLHYINGLFRLDAERKLIPHMPSFGSVIELIDYYIKNTRRRRSGRRKKAKEQVWIDSQGNVYSNILLVRPLRRQQHFPQLQHLARLVINQRVARHFETKEKLHFKVTPVYEASPFDAKLFLDSSDFSEEFNSILGLEKLPLPQTLIQFLKDYPYSH